MPGQPRPPYLDGSAPGDFGFDPLRLGEVPENLERYKESELIHCRWAMLAVAQEWAAIPGGQATYLGNPVPWGTLPTILVIEFFAIAFVEHQRSMEKDPEKKKYPGGAFDPLGFSKDPVKFEEYKVKEIKNGSPSYLFHSPFIACVLTVLIWPSLRFVFLRRSARFAGFRGLLRAAVGVPWNRAIGELGHPPG
ncbi:hypothetical protein GW17_00025479 [Ensete ventricosum]|uniref:Chlorophyll a-b binding protein, chloroplastic n=1 Tax=Ensete ventricosum TaxID=4639 RepID=A0A444EKV1_ENSVE|nr:hypothetical protein B296_00040075 [Ensete ventricosum]RWW10942.1 hypothetical protein GW17_00025479 [Ensete ventricosum]RZR89183.1 hypothetical protein BHM03_00016862 [Ensete ventricosum]